MESLCYDDFRQFIFFWNEKYDAKVKEEKLKGWKAERAASVAQAVVNGALAVTKVLAQTGILSPFAIPAIVAGTAFQIGVIMAQKPPEFYTGVRNFKGGKAIVGDRGPEAINENGNIWIANQPMLVDLEPGTDVYTAADTRKMSTGKSLGDQLYPATNYTIDNPTAKKAEMNYRSPNTTDYTSNTTGVVRSGQTSSSTDNSSVLQKLDQIGELLKQSADKKVNFVYTDYEKFKNEVEQVRISQSG